MSIDAKSFDKHKNPMKYIVVFLRENRNRAFTAEHIAKEIGVDPSEVKGALFFDSLAKILDPQHATPIDYATVSGIIYYKYSGQ
jgi:DNA-directed RNA polymerase specialized sigma subunit